MLSGKKRSPEASPVSRLLIIFGLVLVAVGVLWPVITKLGLGRLPGDLVIERENFRLYIPIATSLVISLLLSVVLWFLSR
jgi:hypothetical protein